MKEEEKGSLYSPIRFKLTCTEYNTARMVHFESFDMRKCLFVCSCRANICVWHSHVVNVENKLWMPFQTKRNTTAARVSGTVRTTEKEREREWDSDIKWESDKIMIAKVWIIRSNNYSTSIKFIANYEFKWTKMLENIRIHDRQSLGTVLINTIQAPRINNTADNINFCAWKSRKTTITRKYT